MTLTASSPAAGAARDAVGFGRAALHAGGLWALAFAQPLFDLLGRGAQFFVARGSTAADIVLLAVAYAFVPPLAGAALVWGLGRIGPESGRAALLVLVALLVAALVLPPVGDALGGSALAVPASVAAGAAAALLYARAAAARAFLTVLSPAPVVVVLLFLLASPVRELVFPSDASGAVAGPSRSDTPIVHVVLDELPTSTLDRGDGRIDPALFPNLAAFARTATWYRNATTVDELTSAAVPAQLTGNRPIFGDLPTAGDNPRSLFTLFARSHELHVVEPITDVCPVRLCRDVRPRFGDRLDALRADLTIVAAHLLLPDDLRDGLPSISEGWGNFDGENTLEGGSRLLPGVLQRLRADDAAAGFGRAIEGLKRPGARPPLAFVHSTLPHGPWRFLPDGRRYLLRRTPYPGLDDFWTDRQWLVDQAFQRHVLQVQDADRLVGDLMDALRAEGLFDDAVIVVTADHGVVLEAGEDRRQSSPRTLADIAAVPLIVKAPGQRRGRVDDGAVRTVDVLPTIARAAGVRLPWRVDGRPADERPVDPAAGIAITHGGQAVLSEPLGHLQARRRARDAREARLLRDGVWAIGPRPDLLGRRVPVGGAPADGPRATIDAAESYADVDPGGPALPLQVSGRLTGLAADAPLAVAVNGTVRATTRAFPSDGRLLFWALVPPRSFVPGRNAVTVHHVQPGGGLRRLSG